MGQAAGVGQALCQRQNEGMEALPEHDLFARADMRAPPPLDPDGQDLHPGSSWGGAGKSAAVREVSRLADVLLIASKEREEPGRALAEGRVGAIPHPSSLP